MHSALASFIMRKKLLAAAALSTGVILQVGCVNVFSTGNPPPFADAPCVTSLDAGNPPPYPDAAPSRDANTTDAGAYVDAANRPLAPSLSKLDAALPPCPKYDAGGYPDAKTLPDAPNYPDAGGAPDATRYPDAR
jgi:hypothetical protein